LHVASDKSFAIKPDAVLRAKILNKKVCLLSFLRHEYQFFILPKCLVLETMKNEASNMDLLTRLASLDLQFARIGLTQILYFMELLNYRFFTNAMAIQTCSTSDNDLIGIKSWVWVLTAVLGAIHLLQHIIFLGYKAGKYSFVVLFAALFVLSLPIVLIAWLAVTGNACNIKGLDLWIKFDSLLSIMNLVYMVIDHIMRKKENARKGSRMFLTEYEKEKETFYKMLINDSELTDLHPSYALIDKNTTTEPIKLQLGTGIYSYCFLKLLKSMNIEEQKDAVSKATFVFVI
jgi:hypothetical protein